MDAIIRIPFADLRGFVPVDTHKLALVTAPAEDGKSRGPFLRHFGGWQQETPRDDGFGIRSAGRYRAWNAFRGTPRFKAVSGRVFVRFCDLHLRGAAVGGLDLGLRISGNPSRMLPLKDILGTRASVAVIHAFEKRETPLETEEFNAIELGPAIARLFLSASSKQGQVEIEDSWIQPCPPIVILTPDSRDRFVWPYGLQKVPLGESTLWHGWTRMHQTVCRLIVFDWGTNQIDGFKRLQRLFLNLHSETAAAIRIGAELVTLRQHDFLRERENFVLDSSTRYQKRAADVINSIRDELARDFGHRLLDVIGPSPAPLASEPAKRLTDQLEADDNPGSDILSQGFVRAIIRTLAGSPGPVVNLYYKPGVIMTQNNTQNVGPVTGGAVSQFGDAKVFNINAFNNSLNNALNTVQKSPAPTEQAKQLMQDLKGHLEKLGGDETVPAETKDEAKRSFDALANEVASPKPRSEWLKISGQGLLDAAKAVAGIAVPIATTVRTLLNLFGVPI